MAPPNVSGETKQEIAASTQSAAPGAHSSGQDAGAAPAAQGAPKVKTEKERKRLPRNIPRRPAALLKNHLSDTLV